MRITRITKKQNKEKDKKKRLKSQINLGGIEYEDNKKLKQGER